MRKQLAKSQNHSIEGCYAENGIIWDFRIVEDSDTFPELLSTQEKIVNYEMIIESTLDSIDWKAEGGLLFPGMFALS